mmetsp:Transcript_53341/g.125447  ORF Transcript_53341/g.125447 Transcript_53341/m.125447 type:complete len:212 (+) Transcript_53341:63-698(+)
MGSCSCANDGKVRARSRTSSSRINSISRVWACARSSNFLCVTTTRMLVLFRPCAESTAAPCSSHNRSLSTTADSSACTSSSSSSFSLNVSRACASRRSNTRLLSATLSECSWCAYAIKRSRLAVSCAARVCSPPLMRACRFFVTRRSCRSRMRCTSSSSSRSRHRLSHCSLWMPLRNSLISCSISTFSPPWCRVSRFSVSTTCRSIITASV